MRSTFQRKQRNVVSSGTVGMILASVLLGFPLLWTGILGATPPAAAAVSSARFVMSSQLPLLPRGARVLGNAPASESLQADVVLNASHPQALANEVASVSNPSSPSYRHFIARGQFAKLYGPLASTISSVRAWLESTGLRVGATSSDGLIIPVSGSAQQFSAAFKVTLSKVATSASGNVIVNTTKPSVPSTIGRDVMSIVGLDGLAKLHSQMIRGPKFSPSYSGFGTNSSGVDSNTSGIGIKSSVPNAKSSVLSRSYSPPFVSSHSVVAHYQGPQACPVVAQNTGIGPGLNAFSDTQLAQIYNYDGAYSQGRIGLGVTVALVEFETFSSSDIAGFQQCYGLHNVVRTISVDGGPGTSVCGQAGCGEAALDIENVAAFAPGSTIDVYEGPNTSGNTGQLDVYQQIASNDTAQVVSTSWGICEPDNTPAGTASAENLIFEQMAAQGQTMIAAAGDTGSEDCLVPSGSSALAVDDPGSQPDVMSAGGTTLVSNSTSGEQVWNNCAGQGATSSCSQLGSGTGAGGGGLSEVWPMPSWQAASGGVGVINSYSTSGQCGSKLCRQVPDVSGSADPYQGYVIYYSGAWEIVGGTSAVAPLWAALIALADQGCASPMGMVDPALYKLGGPSSPDFNDITTGNNDFTGTNNGAYPATPGYDMASGWGSPNGANLVASLQGGDGCPVVTGLSQHEGPLAQGPALTIYGNGLASASAVNFGSIGRGTIVSDSATSIVVDPPSTPTPLSVDVTVTTPLGTSPLTTPDHYGFGATLSGTGYWEVASDGGIFSYGSAPFYGSMGGRALNKPIVGMAGTWNGGGYWEVASDGGIFSFGNAAFYGSMGGRALNKPIVGMASTPNSQGYWEVASDGGIFSFGNAHFYGSMGGRPLNEPIVGMAGTWNGGGYWEVASDGGIFSFGNAAFYGSMGGRPLNQPIVGMASTLGSGGYFEVATDGGLFAFGNAQFYGSMGGQHLNEPVVAMTATPYGGGYWEVATDGGIFSFGNANFYGSAGNLLLNKPVIGMAVA